DVQDLLTAAGNSGSLGFPSAGIIGHVHLQVGDAAAADRFYRHLLCFFVMVHYPGAILYGGGRYRHRPCGIICSSPSAAQRPPDRAWLGTVELIARDAAEIAAIAALAESAGFQAVKNEEGTMLRDPWGTVITLTSR